MIINGINLTNINVVDIDSFAANLVLYYNPGNTASYPGIGTTVYDLSGNNLNGTMSSIIYTNPYFAYNGTDSQLQINNNSLLQPNAGDWTIEIWFNAAGYSSNPNGSVLLGKFDNGLRIEDLSYSVRLSSIGVVYAQIGDGSSFVNSSFYQTSLNTWVQVVYVFNNTTQQNIQTFINGVSIGTELQSLTSVLNTTNDLYLGSYNNGESPQYYNGKIGITRLYSVALTPNQVMQNFIANRKIYNL